MKFLTISLLVVLSSVTCRAQSCLGFTFKTGTTYELATFSGKDKPTGRINYHIDNVKAQGGSTTLDITATFSDEAGKQRSPYTIHYTCTGNELIADMSGMIQGMSGLGSRDMEMKLKANRLAYPGKLSVGNKLSDGQMEAEMLSGGNTMMTMNMTMTNRQVDSQESITTPAGTFNAYKITADVSLDNRAIGIPIRSSLKTVSYRTNDLLFDVKSETYNKNGKLMGYTLLNKIN
ncbi:TapB family protein [Spirosoma rhododendri]|uniref:DUF3108 domain-containing protein n=1 Tax=Spirosoma rhododendri TaxID=2728024 RepID=A0A7L5DIR5_9BACT|nr:hypothetical protein [Spirosoma rhododendri]QJD76983.1 hypothetical protein HH216_00070 [Spirosoma rhododendri]